MTKEPSRETLESGLLRMPDGAEIYWEASGNPRGKPALHLHGGPGSGLRSGSYRSHFGLERYFLIGIDQRGCGRSRPSVNEAPESLQANTTQALIEDIEAVRAHRGVARWLLSGVSWGTTLALAYALAHPDRVTELALVAVTTTSREEVDWLTEGMGRVFPEAWLRFEAESGRTAGERIVEAYARRLATGEPHERQAAARAWNAWESVHISLDPNWTPIESRFDEARGLAFATLVTHYWANDGFLRNGDEIVSRIADIGHIPAMLIHGRRDISGPAIIAWRLHRSWPASRLHIVESEGHGGPESFAILRDALDVFAKVR